MRWAVINKNYKVINIVEWDGVSKWPPPAGCSVERIDNEKVGVGFLYDPHTKSFVKDSIKKEL